jgi:phosphorylcholine metabolism protein LicD
MKTHTHIIFLCLFVIIYYSISQIMYDVHFLTNDMKSSLYTLTGKVHHIMTEHRIRYFIVGGTMLGSARSGEMIPWDDDADIGILEEDLPRFLQIDFSPYGLKQRDVGVDNIGKIFFKDKYDNGKKMESVFVDVFIFRKDGDKIVYTSEFAKKTWPNEYFYENELFPLTMYSYGEHKLYGANNGKAYCQRAWGENWKHPPYLSGRYIKYIIYQYQITVSFLLTSLLIFIYIYFSNNA